MLQGLGLRVNILRTRKNKRLHLGHAGEVDGAQTDHEVNTSLSVARGPGNGFGLTPP